MSCLGRVTGSGLGSGGGEDLGTFLLQQLDQLLSLRRSGQPEQPGHIRLHNHTSLGRFSKSVYAGGTADVSFFFTRSPSCESREGVVYYVQKMGTAALFRKGPIRMLSTHRLLPEMDASGFGVRYEDNLSAYTPPHWHKAMELLLFVKGRVTCTFENARRTFKPGDLYLINSHELHETKCSRGARYLVVHIDPMAMLHYLPTFDQLRFSLAFSPDDQIRAGAFGELVSHMREILSLTGSEDPVALLDRQARLFAVTAILVKHFAQPLAIEETRLRRTDMSRLEPLLEHIQLHHSEELPLDEAVEFMGLNKEYFCRLFKKNMGVSYLQYVYQIRTTAVCRELETTEDPISEIAERHGFRDPKMLGQYFREIYGCTPSEKRKFFREVTIEDDPEEDAV